MTFWQQDKIPARTWQCFICAEKYDNYGDYANHIISEHEEGREFVLCPVECCGAPVRDLPSHFKIKHPKRELPKKGQMRAIIWKDFSPNSKSRRVRKPSFKDGYFESAKNNGAKLHYRSGYELDVYKCLEKDKDVKFFQPEPFKVPYYYKDEWHKYIPDIKVEYVDGVVEIWEVKPNSQKDLEQNQSKWKAMNEYASNLGWRFVVITEQGIEILKNKVSSQDLQ